MLERRAVRLPGPSRSSPYLHYWVAGRDAFDVRDSAGEAVLHSFDLTYE